MPLHPRKRQILLKKIESKSVTVLPNDCRLWLGSKSNGYGYMCFGGEWCGVHRITWILHNGSIPSGLWVLHGCDVRHCVNIRHLFLGTNQDNIYDMVMKDRQQKGERNGQAKLTEADVLEIRRLYESGSVSQHQMTTLFGVCNSVICAIVHRRSWRHIR